MKAAAGRRVSKAAKNKTKHNNRWNRKTGVGRTDEQFRQKHVHSTLTVIILHKVIKADTWDGRVLNRKHLFFMCQTLKHYSRPRKDIQPLDVRSVNSLCLCRRRSGRETFKYFRWNSTILNLKILLIDQISDFQNLRWDNPILSLALKKSDLLFIYWKPHFYFLNLSIEVWEATKTIMRI